jgi:predicted acyl esterase
VFRVTPFVVVMVACKEDPKPSTTLWQILPFGMKDRQTDDHIRNGSWDFLLTQRVLLLMKTKGNKKKKKPSRSALTQPERERERERKWVLGTDVEEGNMVGFEGRNQEEEEDWKWTDRENLDHGTLVLFIILI